jgi:hypothetical protein
MKRYAATAFEIEAERRQEILGGTLLEPTRRPADRTDRAASATGLGAELLSRYGAGLSRIVLRRAGDRI